MPYKYFKFKIVYIKLKNGKFYLKYYFKNYNNVYVRISKYRFDQAQNKSYSFIMLGSNETTEWFQMTFYIDK